MYPASSEGLNKETTDAVYFFTPAFFPLDNFSAHTVSIWNITFPTVEHAFQWKKFSVSSPEIAAEVLAASSPHAVKIISDANKQKVPEAWYGERIAVMELLLEAKAAQHEDVREALHRTGDRNIIENSPVDDYWGIGPNQDGENMLGKLWMRVREQFKN